ncbi:MAG TPA: D-amino acid dehydrogenase [Saccharospirillum sp.]|nr:D-amino acid dehydrogenase [Saccharospirillum sp.]
MHIIILGSGVIGVTSAWYLAQAGHQVTVVDRQPESALETSYANAGQISPGYSAPWAAPGVPLKAIKWLMQDLAPLKITPQLDTHQWRWLLSMLMNCTSAAYETNKSRMLRVAEYSRDSLISLRKETGIAYDHRAQGLIQLFRTNKQVKSSELDKRILDGCGVAYETLGVEDCIQHEPALGYVAHKIKGGLRLPGDETGDCFLFTQRLTRLCQEAGVRFLFDTRVQSLIRHKNQIVAVDTEHGELKADGYLVAMGSFSHQLVKPLGMYLPIYPVKGYSLTLPVLNASRAPESTVMDETHKVAISRLGNRIRVGGTAELSGYNLALSPDRLRNVMHVVSDLFGGATDLAQAEPWTGLRPMTPDGTPIIGKTPVENLFLNTGHGTLGWTMSVGSAKLVTDLIGGKTPGIDPEGLSLERYSKKSGRRIAWRPAT